MTQSIELVSSKRDLEVDAIAADQLKEDELNELIAELPADDAGIDWAWQMIGAEERDRQLLATAGAPEGSAIVSLGAYLREHSTHIYFTVHSSQGESAHSRFIDDGYRAGLSKSVVTTFGKIAYQHANNGAAYGDSLFFRGS